jgi:hypothetical protein
VRGLLRVDTHARTRTHTRARIHIHVHTRTHARARTYSLTLSLSLTHTQTHTRTHTHTHTHTRALTHTPPIGNRISCWWAGTKLGQNPWGPTVAHAHIVHFRSTDGTDDALGSIVQYASNAPPPFYLLCSICSTLLYLALLCYLFSPSSVQARLPLHHS